jgi:hypothetical protein
VAAGRTTALFTITVGRPIGDVRPTITATLGSSSVQGTFLICGQGGCPGAVTLVSLTFNPSTVPGGGTTTGTLTVSPAPSSDTAVTLSSNDSYAPVSSPLIVAAGRTTALFTITVGRPIGDVRPTITATLGSSSVQGTFLICGQSGCTPAILALTVDQTDTSQCPAIRLTASATYSGQALTGLGAANFTLSEDGQTRSLTVSPGTGSGRYVIAYTTPTPATSHQVMLTVNYAGQSDSKTTTVPCCGTGCGCSSILEPSLNITLQPGFYIAEVTGSTEGYWGMEALAQRGDLSGGFNLGGGLQEKGITPAFGGFYLRDTQSVFIRATAQVVPGGNASDFSMCVRLLLNNSQPIGTDQCGTTVVELQRTLSSGFYVVQVRSGGSSPRATLQLGLGANYFSGGVDVGGFVAPGLTGFGAFFLPADQGAQEAKIKVLGRPTYDSVGTCNLQLRLLDGNRNLIKTVP